jgi:hypothetical protein
MGLVANGFRLCTPLGVGECARQLVWTSVIHAGGERAVGDDRL